MIGPAETKDPAMSQTTPDRKISTEEILASIRRTISEDGIAPAPGEDILDLTREVREDGTVVDIATGAAVRATAGRSGGSGPGGRTVEEIVEDVVRPMVGEWLDRNLPALVERMIGREIERMSRRTGDAADRRAPR